MWKIKKNVFLDIMDAAKNNYPNEFASLLGGNKEKQLINEFVVPPFISDNFSASLNLYALPIDNSIIGSIHSHPTGKCLASIADLSLFSKYLVNIIVYWPFNQTNFVAYNSKGKRIDVLIE
jgi:proteasome lid subunit RPN8/RPN11